MPRLDLIGLLEQYKDEDTPRALEQLPHFAEQCRRRGHKGAGDYLDNLYSFIKYHIEREWDDDTTTVHTTRQQNGNEDSILWQDGVWKIAPSEDTS